MFFAKGRLPKGVGRQVNHMFMYFHHKIRKLKLFIVHFCFFSPKGVGRHIEKVNDQLNKV